MFSLASNRSRRVRAGASIASIAAAFIATAAGAQATSHSEGAVVPGTYTDVSGKPGLNGPSGTCVYTAGVGTCATYSEPNDFSSSAHTGQTISPTPTNPSPSDNGPTNIGALGIGSNIIAGASIPYGPVANTMTHELQYQDNDYITFTVPVGAMLSSLFLSTGSSIAPGDRAFIGLASGANVYVSLPSSAGLLGYTLLMSSQIGSNILPAIGSATPSGFDSTAPGSPFAGATRFSGPLSSGTYTLWLLDGDNPFTYRLDAVVSGVPEPATWSMLILGFGAIGYALRRRRTGARLRLA